MTNIPPPGLSYWQNLPDAQKQAARACIRSVIETHCAALVDTFYSTFLDHETSSSFLSHSLVQERLSSSLARWLRSLVDMDPLIAGGEFHDYQLRIGKVHARIGIPGHLVLAGASVLKTAMARQLPEACPDARTLLDSLILMEELVDHAMRIMNQAYESSTQEVTKDNEAYRFMALVENMDLERESQRAALMEWGQRVLFGLLAKAKDQPVATLGASPFGLWVRHRARLLFSDADLLKKIERAIAEIDTILLPNVCKEDDDTARTAAITTLHNRVEEVKYLLGSLFQAASSMESGRDPLTRTLNRRFLPGLLAREFALVKAGHVPLSLLMVDVDHFKQINDTYGHTFGDTVLKRVAETVLDSVRASDFVFRYGGEEFLIALVETERDKALVIAERLRTKVQNLQISPDNGPPISVTVSIGLATYEGHPDPQYLIDQADRALYQAKETGRNRVAVA